MTADVAQAIADPLDWSITLRAHHGSPSGGTLLFETRDPATCAWREWTREATQRTGVLQGSSGIMTAGTWTHDRRRWTTYAP